MNLTIVQHTSIHHVVYLGAAIPENVLATVVDQTDFSDEEATAWDVVARTANIFIKNKSVKKLQLRSKSFATVQEALDEIKRVYTY